MAMEYIMEHFKIKEMRIIFLTIVIFALTNCKGQDKQENSQKDTIMKTFDIETFNKNKDKSQKYQYRLNDSSIIEESILNDKNYIQKGKSI